MYPNPMVEGDNYSFKRPGAVPFQWEVRPGVPKTQPGGDDDDDDDDDDDHHHPTHTHLQPPKTLAPIRLKPFPPSESRSRPVSPFAPPSSFKLKSPPPDSDSQCSGPPNLRSSSPRAGGCLFPKSLFGWKKSTKSSDIKKTTGQESSSSSSEFENFYETGSTFSRSEDSSQGSVSSRWGSPKSSFSSRRGSPLKRTDSDCMRKTPF